MDTKSVSKENYIISDDNIRSNIVKISNLARNLLHIYQAISLRSCFVRKKRIVSVLLLELNILVLSFSTLFFLMYIVKGIKLFSLHPDKIEFFSIHVTFYVHPFIFGSNLAESQST